jgi:hypothetical protein
MNSNKLHIRKPNTKFLEYFLLITFTVFSMYYSISSYRLYRLNTNDLKVLTDKVESVTFKKGQGKQGKSEVFLDLGLSGKFRVAYGNNEMIHALSNEITKGDVVSIYLKKNQHVFINLGLDNDILQIAKSGQVIYSLDNAQKSFHDSFLLSAITSFLLPLGCIFYWVKSKSNLMLERLQTATLQTQVSTK